MTNKNQGQTTTTNKQQTIKDRQQTKTKSDKRQTTTTNQQVQMLILMELLQIIIWKDQPPANDNPDQPASCACAPRLPWRPTSHPRACSASHPVQNIHI